MTLKVYSHWFKDGDMGGSTASRRASSRTPAQVGKTWAVNHAAGTGQNREVA